MVGRCGTDCSDGRGGRVMSGDVGGCIGAGCICSEAYLRAISSVARGARSAQLHEFDFGGEHTEEK